MRSVPVAKLFLILLGTTFLLVVVFSIRVTYKFDQFSTEASRLAQNVRDTSALNIVLRDQLNHQINLVYRQLEHVEPDFPAKLTAITFALGEQQIRSVTLN